MKRQTLSTITVRTLALVFTLGATAPQSGGARFSAETGAVAVEQSYRSYAFGEVGAV